MALQNTLTTSFGEFRPIRLLGEGGMASVYLAELLGSSGFRREVALKVIHSHHVSDQPEFTRWFIGEARLGGYLIHHNIVQTLFFGEQDGRPFMAMEYVEGPTLQKIVLAYAKTDEQIPLSIILASMIQVCEGLDYAHGATDAQGKPLRMVHRDLKPSNILITHHGIIKIADFGVARAESNVTRTLNPSTIKGTMGYMSPEQAQGSETLDHRSDLFAVGLVLYELLMLTPLYDGKSMMALWGQAITADVGKPLAALPESPIRNELLAFLTRTLAVDPADRFQSAGEMVTELERFLQMLPDRLSLKQWIKNTCAILVQAAGNQESSYARKATPADEQGGTPGGTRRNGHNLSHSAEPSAEEYFAPLSGAEATVGGRALLDSLRAPEAGEELRSSSRARRNASGSHSDVERLSAQDATPTNPHGSALSAQDATPTNPQNPERLRTEADDKSGRFGELENKRQVRRAVKWLVLAAAIVVFAYGAVLTFMALPGKEARAPSEDLVALTSGGQHPDGSVLPEQRNGSQEIADQETRKPPHEAGSASDCGATAGARTELAETARTGATEVSSLADAPTTDLRAGPSDEGSASGSPVSTASNEEKPSPVGNAGARGHSSVSRAEKDGDTRQNGAALPVSYFGMLTLNSRPPSTILLDDRTLPTFPVLDRKVSVGVHTVEFRCAGRPPAMTKISVETDSKVMCYVNCELEQPAVECRSAQGG